MFSEVLQSPQPPGTAAPRALDCMAGGHPGCCVDGWVDSFTPQLSSHTMTEPGGVAVVSSCVQQMGAVVDSGHMLRGKHALFGCEW
jgi:hypothetical protein